MREVRGRGAAALKLTVASLAAAVRELSHRDPALARIVRAHGTPPLWARRPGFATLARIVLEQQVSLASAATLYRRMAAELPSGWTPGSVLAVGEDGLRARGLTRQKARYVAELAAQVHDGRLDLAGLARLDDDAARARLVALPGIGPWTAGIYLLMALGRPDVWPPGDLALHKVLAGALGMPRPPSSDEATHLAERWAPWRAVAARILWHGYLAERVG